MKEGRFGEIKTRRNEVVENLTKDSDNKDKGLIRKEIFLISEEKDKNLLPEEKKEISDRMINRYFLDYGVSERGNNTCVDAIHSQMANTGEIVKILKRKPEWKNTEATEIINKGVVIAENIVAIRKNSPQRDIFSIINELTEKYGSDKLSIAILKIKELHEDYVGSLAQEIAKKSDSSYYIARKTRRFMDANRPENVRKISDKNSREEFGHGYYDAQYQLIKKFSENSAEYQENNKELSKPFLHISLHGKSDKPGDAGDVIVSNGLRNGKMPCDPQIARWFSDRLNSKIKERKLSKNENEYYFSGVAKEGSRFCGNVVHTERRFGNKTFNALGGNYQYIQVEMCLPLRKKYFSELQDALGEILIEFQEQFRNSDDLKTFLQSKMTLEDEFRLEGKLYARVAYFSNIPAGVVQLSESYRLALGIEIGEKVLINKKEFVVGATEKDKLDLRKPILNSSENFFAEVVIERMVV
ncbi:MAG: hypothetical protein ACD_7C00083G0010 [uncultured bacterium]|nr:MAG: hypothetical protein ACD_7C00083G0010 [uncultured bacterium]HBR79667.1 hypothetical protein [Candidatus Moranbacteria bacterium]